MVHLVLFSDFLHSSISYRIFTSFPNLFLNPLNFTLFPLTHFNIDVTFQFKTLLLNYSISIFFLIFNLFLLFNF